MATSTTYDDQQSISTDGFICSDDTVLGLRVSTMRQDNVPLGSVGGFMFFKQNVLDNSSIMETTRSYLQCESVGLGLYRTLGPVPGAYSFRKSNPGLPVESVVIHVLAKNTKIVIWKDSHRIQVPFSKGSIGLWQALPSDLLDAGSQRVERTFDNGGYCIRDTRVFMEVLQGSALTFAIGNRGALQKWGPMELNESLKPTIEAIQTPVFEVNVIYSDEQRK